MKVPEMKVVTHGAVTDITYSQNSVFLNPTQYVQYPNHKKILALQYKNAVITKIGQLIERNYWAKVIPMLEMLELTSGIYTMVYDAWCYIPSVDASQYMDAKNNAISVTKIAVDVIVLMLSSILNYQYIESIKQNIYEAFNTSYPSEFFKN